MHGATLLDAADKPLRPGDPVERRPLVRRMRASSSAACPTSRSVTGNLVDAGLHRPEDAVGRRPRAGDRQGDQARAAAQGLRAAAPLRRGGLRNVRRRGNLVARCRQAALGRATCSRRPASTLARDAAPRRRLRGLGAISRPRSPRPGASTGAGSRSPGAAATTRPPPSASARPTPGDGLRFARHLGRRVLGHRPLRQPARAHAARLLPRAAEPLARHVGDAVGGLFAVLDRGRPRPRARHRRPGRRGAEAFARSQAAVASAPVFLPYLSGERTPHNDAEATGHVRWACARATAPTRWSSR